MPGSAVKQERISTEDKEEGEDEDIHVVAIKKPKTRKKYKKRYEEIDVGKVFDRPGKRQAALPQKFEQKEGAKPERFIWTVEEKKQLLEALQKYSIHDVESIDACIPTKPRKIWQRMVYYWKSKYRKKQKTGEDFIAPIELWLKTASDITELEPDYTSELAQVMSIAGHLEPHDPSRKHNPGDPDWNKLYQYLARLLQGETDVYQNLSSIEAAVVLDMLQNLSDHLNSLDTSQQRELMRMKYQQLSKNYKTFSETNEIEALTHGLEKDPLEDEIPEYVPTYAQNQSASSADDQQQPSTSSSTRAPRKSTLFTINPFSIPVKYLKPEVAELETETEPPAE